MPTESPHGPPNAAMTVADRVRVHPGPLTGSVVVPGDKSISHRALLIGALTDGAVSVRGLAPSGDVAATAGALRLLGAVVDVSGNDGGLAGTVAGPLVEASDVVDCGNSGTAMRLLAGVTAGIDGLAVLTGDASLRRRPMDRVVAPLRAMGAHVDGRAGGMLPPVVVRGGGLRGVHHVSPVASAQVKSAVMLAGLRADGPTEVTSPARSRDHTERLVTYLGGDVTVRHLGDGREVVALRPGGLQPRPVDVPGDPSSAAFWMVAAAAAINGRGDGVELPGLCANPTRLGVVDVLRAMDARLEIDPTGEVSGEPRAAVRVWPADLTGATVAGSAVVDALDELPVLAVAGALSRDGLVVRDAAELRVKESDRIAALAATLQALGVTVHERPDGFEVPGGQRPGGGTVHARGDHRIAMTACVAATYATGPVEVRGFGCVATSYPSFLEHLRGLGGTVEVLDRPGAA
ncbi:MAG: 3-phosphoshikimate 1-carboxyvinyltransferase [Actinomycetota bacterium]|nr:3-phosphoshikimate 1-carboxyvinyltransferase [Actinomycetota bacterium]